MRSFHRVAAAAMLAGVVAACGAGRPGPPVDTADADLAVAATDFAFHPSEPTVDDGDVTVVIDNEGAVPHTWVVEGLEGQLKLDAAAGQADRGTITLTSGTYTFYCDIPGHRAAGMEGTVIVD